MRKIVFELVWGCGAVFWVAVCWRARALSARYNGWTARLRTRFPQWNPPPTPRMLETNTRIMTWIVRLMGLWFALLSALALAAGLASR
jgi:hypothetical protein